MVQAANCAMCDGSPRGEPAPRRTTCFLFLPNPPWVLDTRHQFTLGAIVWILNCIPRGWWGLCSTTPLFNLKTKVKQSFLSERRKPYRPALATCSATMRDGLFFAWHSSLQLTPWGRMQNSTWSLLWLYLGSLHQRIFEFAPYIGWRRSEKEGLLAVLASLSAFPAKSVEQGEKYALWSQGPLIDKTGSHWFWVFAFFLCTSNKEHWNSLPKLQGFHTSKSGLSLYVSDINWIG